MTLGLAVALAGTGTVNAKEPIFDGLGLSGVQLLARQGGHLTGHLSRLVSRQPERKDHRPAGQDQRGDDALAGHGLVQHERAEQHAEGDADLAQ